MSDKEYKTDYEVDIDEYRALFQRIETGGRIHTESHDKEPERVKKEYKPSENKVRPEKQGVSFDNILNSVKKQITDTKNKPKKELPLITKLYKASVFIFAGVLLFFGFISAVDKNKTKSEIENRALAEKPRFSFASFFSEEDKDGDGQKDNYNSLIEKYYSDHFPARDFFIKCSQKINKFFTQFSADEDGGVLINTKKKDSDFVGEGVDVFTEEQKRKYGIKENTAAVTPDDEATDNGEYLLTSDRGFEIYYHSDDNVKNYSDMINKAAKSMPAGVKFYNMLCPTAIEFYGTAEHRQGVHSQRDSIKKVYSMLDNSVITVDAYSNLVDSTNDYIYFRTDHHWTARGAYCGYKAFCDASGNTAPALSTFKTHTIDGFLGSVYRETQQPQVLADHPDSVECFELAVDAKCTVYASPDMTEDSSAPGYVVAQTVNDSNKYMAFIGGDEPLEKITTSVRNGKKILVIKESYGNAFVPFLCNNYEEIYVVDPRKIDMNLVDFIEKNGINEVIAVNYMFALGNSFYRSEFEKMFE